MEDVIMSLAGISRAFYNLDELDEQLQRATDDLAELEYDISRRMGPVDEAKSLRMRAMVHGVRLARSGPARIGG